MSDSFHSLIEAILADDPGETKKLLRRDAALVNAVAPEARLETRIGHWIYAGDTALHVAAAGHRVEILKQLLSAGADVSAAMNHRRSQPLHYAADGSSENPSWNAKRQVATLRLLLEAGADLHAQDKNGATPLHRAVRTRCSAAVQFLLQSGSDAALRNKPGSTAFHLAVQNTGRGGSGSEQARAAQREIIATFLKQGVRPSIEDGNGKSVLAWARSDWIRQMLEG
jgi:hypothetical protein